MTGFLLVTRMHVREISRLSTYTTIMRGSECLVGACLCLYVLPHVLYYICMYFDIIFVSSLLAHTVFTRLSFEI